VKEVEVKYIDITNFDEDPNAHYLHQLFNDIVNNNKDKNIVYFFDGKEYTKKFRDNGQKRHDELPCFSK